MGGGTPPAQITCAMKAGRLLLLPGAAGALLAFLLGTLLLAGAYASGGKLTIFPFFRSNSGCSREGAGPSLPGLPGVTGKAACSRFVPRKLSLAPPTPRPLFLARGLAAPSLPFRTKAK